MNSMLQRMRRHSGSAEKSGQHLRGVVRFFSACLLLFLSSSVAAQGVELKEIARLAKGGAAELALNLLDENQPAYEDEADLWLRWERVRVRILEQRGQWPVLAKRLATLPQGVSEDFLLWAKTRRARALILSQQFGEARQLLRELLWSDRDRSPDTIAQWRQLVMQSYLHEGRVDDAYVAMLRYHQDYGEGGKEAIQIRARILLASGRPGEARSLLETLTRDRTAELLWRLAQLRSGDDAGGILDKLWEKKELADTTPLQQYLYYGVMAEAALAAEEPAYAVIALEHWYRLEPPVEEWHEVFELRPDQLWQSYLAYALYVGNQEQLLVGNDAAWFKLANETSDRYPVRKRSLYAQLAQQAYSEEFRNQAAQQLAALLQEQDNGMALVQQLFMNSDRYPVAAQLPTGVAYLLVDQAIRDADLPMASRLLQQLPEPPENTARLQWQLRRVKVFILAGEYDAAEGLLHRLILQANSLDTVQRDQVIQLLFDLQTVGEHESAYNLLAEVYQTVPDLKLRRELLFWMADSRVAQKNYVAAARLYLRSATLLDVNSMDPWAQTARYKAAETLLEGRMLTDAAHIYSQLLQITEAPERRAVLRRGLEKIRMLQAADGKQ